MSGSDSASSLDWINSFLKRFKNLLPQGSGSSDEVLLSQTSKSLVELSTVHFHTIVSGLLAIFTELPPMSSSPSPEASQVHAIAAVLHCISSCLARKHSLSSREEMDVIQAVSYSSCQLALLSESDHNELSCEAQLIIHHISRIHFHCIYSKIVTKLSGMQTDPVGGPEECSLMLIQYMDLNLQRLNQILAAFVATFKDLKKNKTQLTTIIPPIIHQAVWNFIMSYPEEFNDLINQEQSHLATHAEKLFDQLEGYADSTKKKVQLWPLMNVLLILCPRVLKQIVQNTADREGSRYKSKRTFLNSVEKAVTAPGSYSSSNKILVEIAVVCGVELTKACTYVNDHDNTILRYFVAVMQTSLQDLLFNPSNLFIHNTSSQTAGVPTFSDLTLMVDCFIALYRINHRNNHLVKVCMDEKAPNVFHIVFARSVHTLLTQKSVLSWWPEKETIYSVAPTLRRLFQEYLNIVRRHDRTAFSSHEGVYRKTVARWFDRLLKSMIVDTMKDVRAFSKDIGSCTAMLYSKPKTERKALVELVLDCQVLIWVIRCFYADPVLAFTYINVDGQHMQSLQLMTGLATLVQDPSAPVLSRTAAQTLLRLHEPKYIELWDSDDTMIAFWDISCQIAFSFTMKLISHKATDVGQMLNWLKQILDYQQQFLQMHKETAMVGTSCKIFLQTQNRLEMALLTFLRNTNLHNVKIALTCFRFLVQLTEVLITTGEPCPVPFADNIKPYQALSDASSNLLIGRAAQQKTICTIFKDVVYTPGSYMAWEDTLSSWKSLTTILRSCERDDSPPPQPDVLKLGAEVIMRSRRIGSSSRTISSRPHIPEMTNDDLQHIIAEWTNMSGFLCSLGGVATGGGRSVRPMSTVPSASSVESLTTLNMYSSTSSIARSNSFTSHDQLSVAAKGRSRFRLSVNMGSYCNTEESNVSNCSLFIDDLVSLLTCVNERVGVKVRETVKEVLSYGLSPALYPYFFQKIDSMLQPKEKIQTYDQQTTFIDQITMIIQHILESRSETSTIAMVNVKMDLIISKLINYADQLPLSQQAISIKIKLCQLLQTMMDCRTDLSYHHQMRFRNEAVEKLTEWLTSHKEKKSVSFTDLLSQVPQMPSLIQDLDIASMKAVALLLDGLPLQPPESSERNGSDEKGKIFYKYFSLFMELIREHFGSHNTLASPESIQQQQQQRNVFSLKQYTITAMSNMLMANIECGLSHAVNLGYHEEVLLRTTFMDVLTSVFKKGVEFGSLGGNNLANRYSQLVEFVTTVTEDGDMPIITLFSEAIHPNNMDELARVLVIMFDWNHKLTDFLMKVFQMEVCGSANYRSDALFRGNSLSCKVLSQCFKIFGNYYLQAELRPLVQNTLQSNKNNQFEVDPVKLQDEDQLMDNQRNLMELAKSFLDSIITSLPGIPLQLRTVCHCLFIVVAGSFPDTALDTVNSAFFLRFISPALVSPEIYGIVSGDRLPSPRIQRGMMLLSKILQNLANHVLFKKEKHMLVFNDFLKENFERSRDFVTKISAMGPYEEGEAIESISFMKESDKYSLHQILWDNEDHLSNAIIAMRSVSFYDRAWYQPVQKLETILAQLGSPYQHLRKVSMGIRRNTTVNNINTQLETFLESMAPAIDDHVMKQARKVFYHGGPSKAGHHVFYCILRKLYPDQSNKVLYYAITLMRKFADKSFELVVDLTMSSASNEPELELLINFAVLVPELTMCQLETIYLYNCNRSFKKYANQLAYRIFSHMKGAKKVVAVDNASRLTQYIDEHNIVLSKLSQLFEDDKSTKIYSPCQLLCADEKETKYFIRLKISEHGLVLHYSERMQVFGVNMYIKDIYHVSNIKEAQGMDGEPNKLMIRLTDGHNVSLLYDDRHTVLEHIYLITSKWQSQQPYMELSDRKLQPKDVPGTLLNVALFNLCGSDVVQRAAAYQLLCAVKESFQLLPDTKLLSTAQGLHIPANNTLFVKDISAKLAEKEKQLTLELLSEALTGLQKNGTTDRQLILLYIKPWLFNLEKFCSGEEREKKKIHNILGVLVQLGISSPELFPMLQAEIWNSIATLPELLPFVLEYFFKSGNNAGLNSVKTEILAETTVTLATVNTKCVANITVTAMLKLLEETSNEPTLTLNQHFLWTQIAVLARFIHRLTFHNKIDVLATLPELCYITTMLMGQGDTLLRTTMHGIVLNILHSLTMLPELSHSDKLIKILSLKMVELELPKWYLQFGIQQVKSSATVSFRSTLDHHHHHHHRHISTPDKDAVNVHSLTAITELFNEVMEACIEQLEGSYTWFERWHDLTVKSALAHNPSLQSRSFLALGYITKNMPDDTLAKILNILGKTIANEQSLVLAEAILRCLTKAIHLLEKTSLLLKHLFWISVTILQLQEPITYVAAQLLLYECVKLLDAEQSFLKESLSHVVQEAREEHIHHLKLLDHEIGLSFTHSFDFALSTLLYRGFHHSNSATRLQTLRLFCLLYSSHTASEERHVGKINESSLAYLTVLFIHSEHIRSDLFSWELSQETSFSHDSCCASLLDKDAIKDTKAQMLFLLTIASALIYMHDNHDIKLLYQFLSKASVIFDEVYPHIHRVLVPHIALTLSQSQDHATLSAIHKLIETFVKQANNKNGKTLSMSYITDIGFNGMTELFGPFIEYNSAATIEDNKLTHVQNYINSVVENHLPFDDDDVFISKQRHSVGQLHRCTTGGSNITFSRSKSTEDSGSY